jgi:hypothetical protein
MDRHGMASSLHRAALQAGEHRKIMGTRAPIREVRKHLPRDRPDPTLMRQCDDFPTAAGG